MRVLLIYPNERDMSLVPPVIGLFSRLLKDRGMEVGLFDSTGYDFEGKVDSNVEEERNLFYKPTEPSTSKGVKRKLTNMYDDFVDKVNSFSPDLLAMTVTESTFLRGVSLLRYLRETKKQNVLTVVGGVFPTFAPDIVMQQSVVDMVCVGEGDHALVDLAERVRDGKDFMSVPNLWIRKSDGTLRKNRPGPAVNINELPPIDFTIFEDDRFYRPMRGSVYRMLPVETHRGCPYTCTFCNSPAQNVLYKDLTESSFFRKKSAEKIREELVAFREQWDGEYVFFWADTFLAWKMEELEEFCEMYSEFRFPFWCQSRPETVSDAVNGFKKLKMLKDVGMHHMSFGLEHGNEGFRRDVIDRNYSNKDAIEAMKNPGRVGIPFTINNIIGFPDETHALAMDTVELNRQIDSFNLSCSTFAPFHGTELRTRAEKKGYVAPGVITPPNADWSILDMPNFPKEQIFGLQRMFVMYSKFPKSRWPDMKKGEELTPKGDAVWESFREEFLKTYFQEPEPKIARVNDGQSREAS